MLRLRASERKQMELPRFFYELRGIAEVLRNRATLELIVLKRIDNKLYNLFVHGTSSVTEGSDEKSRKR